MKELVARDAAPYCVSCRTKMVLSSILKGVTYACRTCHTRTRSTIIPQRAPIAVAPIISASPGLRRIEEPAPSGIWLWGSCRSEAEWLFRCAVRTGEFRKIRATISVSPLEERELRRLITPARLKATLFFRARVLAHFDRLLTERVQSPESTAPPNAALPALEMISLTPSAWSHPGQRRVRTNKP